MCASVDSVRVSVEEVLRTMDAQNVMNDGEGREADARCSGWFEIEADRVQVEQVRIFKELSVFFFFVGCDRGIKVYRFLARILFF